MYPPIGEFPDNNTVPIFIFFCKTTTKIFSDFNSRNNEDLHCWISPSNKSKVDRHLLNLNNLKICTFG